MREGDIYVVLGCCLKSCEESGRFYQQSGGFVSLEVNNLEGFVGLEVSSWGGFVSLEVSSLEGFVSQKSAVREVL